jgi:hypothetical protein
VSTPAGAQQPGQGQAGPTGPSTLLIVLGVAAVALALSLRAVLAVSSKQTTEKPDGTVEVVTKREPLPDSVTIGLLSLGGLLIVAGAFYSRVTKLSFGQFSAEFVARQEMATRAVARMLAQRADELDVDPARLASAAALAANLTAARSIQLAAPVPTAPERADVRGWRAQPDAPVWDALAAAALDEVLTEAEPAREPAPPRAPTSARRTRGRRRSG